MITFKQRRVKIGTVLTCIDKSLPVALRSQYESLATLSVIAPKVMVSGIEEIPNADGIEAVRTGATSSIKNALATYIQRFRGNEGVVLTNPEVMVERDLSPLLKYVEDNKYDLTWAAHSDINGAPRFFVMSAQVVQHVWNDIDDKMAFSNDWQAWLHSWMDRLLRQRYFDATPLLLATKLPSIEIVAPEPAKQLAKKQVVRKVKHS